MYIVLAVVVKFPRGRGVLGALELHLVLNQFNGIKQTRTQSKSPRELERDSAREVEREMDRQIGNN